MPAALLASRGADAGGAWTQVTRPLPPGLVGGVLRCAGWTEDGTAPRTRCEAGAPTVLLMLQVGAPLVVGGRPVGSFVAAASDVATRTSAVGAGEGVHLDLTPAAARRVLGFPLAELRQSTLDVRELGLGWLVELTERVAAAPDWGDRFDLVETALLQRVAHGPAAADGSRVERARRLLDRGARVEEVGAAVGWSRRHLHRRVTAEVGLTPSQVRRLGRFRRTQRLLETTDLGLAEVAARTGWADQSHLHREVRAIAGCTPTRLRGRVPSVQDTGASAVPPSGA